MAANNHTRDAESIGASGYITRQSRDCMILLAAGETFAFPVGVEVHTLSLACRPTSANLSLQAP